MLAQIGKIVEAIVPQAGAAINGDWVSLKNYHKCTVILHMNHANAALGDVTVDKATDVAGTGISAAITLNNWWRDDDCATSDALVKQTAAAAAVFVAGITHQILVIEIETDGLGVTAVGVPFDCIRINTAASHAANITEAMYILYEPRYAQATPPSAIVD